MPKKQYGYLIFRTNPNRPGSESWNKLDIQVVNFGDGRINQDPIFSLKWQADSIVRDDAPDDPYWYGCSLTLARDSADNYDGLMIAVGLVRRLLPKDRSWFSFRPSDFIAKLERCRIERVIYDSRLSYYIGVDDIQDPDLDRWMATNDRGNCSVDCLAYDERDAKKKLLMSFASADYYSSTSDLEWWLANGRPMRSANSGSWPSIAPVVIPAGKLLELPKRELIEAFDHGQ